MTSETSWVESMPEIYDRCLGPALFAPFAEHLATIAESLHPARVLEVAAGTGIATAALARHLPGATITATDLNPGMVDRGRQQVPGATWQPADGQALPFPSGSVDLVVCQFGVMFFPDRRLALTEVARVLAPGGTLLLATWDELARSTFASAVAAALEAEFPDDPPTFVARVPYGYHDLDVIRADLDAGGLTTISLERVTLPGHAPSAAVLAEGFCLGTPLRFGLEERGRPDDSRAAVADRMTASLGAGPVTGDLVAIVVTARNPH